MPTARFQIGEAFPASDPIARFVTVLGMMSNAWLRSTEDLLAINDDDPDSGARRVMLFRQQASLHYEAVRFLRESPRQFPEVETLIASLPAEAQAEYAQIAEGIDPDSAHFLGEWLADHRHVTFHFPVMHADRYEQGQEEIAQALAGASELDGTIEHGEEFGSVRFRFADDVAVQWLPDPGEQERLIAALREAVMALGRFVQVAAREYLQGRPAGTFTIEN